MFDAILQDLELSDEIVRYVKIARDALFTNSDSVFLCFRQLI